MCAASVVALIPSVAVAHMVCYFRSRFNNYEIIVNSVHGVNGIDDVVIKATSKRSVTMCAAATDKAMPVVLSKEYLLYIQDINLLINTTNRYYV